MNLTIATSHNKMPAGNTQLKTWKQMGCFMFKAHSISSTKEGKCSPLRMWKKEKVRGSLVGIVINLLKSPLFHHY